MRIKKGREADLISSENKASCSNPPVSLNITAWPLPSSSTYFSMPAKEKKTILCPFLSQLLMIAAVRCFPLGPTDAHLKNRPDVLAGCQPQFFFGMQTLILCVFLRTGVAHTPASQLSRPFSCTCPPLVSAWLAASLQAAPEPAGGPAAATLAYNETSSRTCHSGRVTRSLLSGNWLVVVICFC